MKSNLFDKTEKRLLWTLTGLCLFLGLVACSDDKDVAGGTSDDAGIVAITNKEIAGVSQKGRFWLALR